VEFAEERAAVYACALEEAGCDTLEFLYEADLTEGDLEDMDLEPDEEFMAWYSSTCMWYICVVDIWWYMYGTCGTW
jgi:hypothetical protein